VAAIPCAVRLATHAGSLAEHVKITLQGYLSKRCVYVADSEALAILEVLVHLDKPDLINAYRLFRVHLLEKIE
jgi:hypothetical protein